MQGKGSGTLVIALVLLAVGCGSSSSASSPERPPDPTVVAFAVTREDLLNATGASAGSYDFVYSTEGNLERTDAVGQPSDYATFEYDPTGAQVIKEKHYGVNDTLNSEIDYAYTDGVLSEAVTYDGNGVVLSYEDYVFANGKKMSAVLHAGSVHLYTFGYDATDGKRTGMIDKLETATGSTMNSSSAWHYDASGAPTSVEIFAADGTTVSSSRNLTTVPSGSNYDYFEFWDF